MADGCFMGHARGVGGGPSRKFGPTGRIGALCAQGNQKGWLLTRARAIWPRGLGRAGHPPRATRRLASRAPPTALLSQGGKSVNQARSVTGGVAGENAPLVAGGVGARVPFSRTPVLQAAASLKPAGASRSLAEEIRAGTAGKTEQGLLCPPCLP